MLKQQLILILLVFFCLPSARAQDTTIVENWPNGNKKKEWTGTITSYEFSRIFSGGPNEGVTKEWFENGLQKSVTAFVAGKEHGTWEAWHSNGQKWVEQRFEVGQPTGTWKIWNEKGKIIAMVTFYNGIPAKGNWILYEPGTQKIHKVKVLKNNRSLITGPDKDNNRSKRNINNIDYPWWKNHWY
jgi:antitoxin component YwqK of YwqJK toxin-antitoxin module